MLPLVVEEPGRELPVDRLQGTSGVGAMEMTSGLLWALQVVVGPLVLGIALAYAAFQWRRRRRLQGEGNYTAREIATIAIPVVIAVALFTIRMMIPGSR